MGSWAHVGIRKEYMATTTPPHANMQMNLAASTLLPVYRAEAKAEVIVTPAVTSAALITSHQGYLNPHDCCSTILPAGRCLTWQVDKEVCIQGIMTQRGANQGHKCRTNRYCDNDADVDCAEALREHGVAHEPAEARDPELLQSPENEPEDGHWLMLRVASVMIVHAVPKALCHTLRNGQREARAWLGPRVLLVPGAT